MHQLRTLSFVALPLLAGFVIAACGSSTRPGGFNADPDGGTQIPNDAEKIEFDGSLVGEGGVPGEVRDPVTCAEALTSKSYVGCDYWPTITPNPVWNIFDYAVIVANTGAAPATVTVTGANGVNKTETIPAGELKKIFLPWVSQLKGGDFNSCGSIRFVDLAGLTRVVPNGAYHLVSSVPVIVYQFNALEYKGVGGTPGKDWSQCPGSKICIPSLPNLPILGGIGCFSYSNDASLLLPSTAMTQTYRVTGVRGDTVPAANGNPAIEASAGYIVVTATQDATAVTLKLSSSASVVAGNQISAASAGGTVQITLAKAGDVALISSSPGKSQDLSGSIVSSTKPVQVISGTSCANMPDFETRACDHVEESVLPAETLGKRYVVTAPSKPAGGVGKHVLRFVGNVDGTTLTYVPAAPAGCPTSLNAGQVVECGVVETDIEVTGSKEFAVLGFQVGATLYNPPASPQDDLRGDPSQTSFPAVEQYRSRYVFLAPDDYAVNYADISCESSAVIKLDSVVVSAPFAAIGNSGYGVRRVKLGVGKGGAHLIESDKPVGVQVLGYGDNTSYQYPAGLNLKLIAPPPITN